MKITLEIKPLSSNRAWQGRRFKTPDYDKFETDVSFLLLPFPHEVINGKLQVHYRFYLKNHKAMDYDNCIKSLQDVLVKRGYISDDRMVYRAIIDKIPSDKDYIEIEVAPLDNEETLTEVKV